MLLALALYQEWIELDLFHDGLARFSVEEFEAAGLTVDDRFLTEFMADQDVGHATLITNILGPAAPFLDFCQKLARFGESGVYGFLHHLDSREAGQLLLQSISTEARQQIIFLQFDGLFPMPIWFEANPARQNANNTKQSKKVGSTGAALLDENVVSKSDQCLDSGIVGEDCSPAITHNRSIPLSFPGRKVYFSWELPGQAVGPNNSYVTTTAAGAPKFVAWVTQLNLMYSKLTLTSNTTGTTIQLDTSTFEGDPSINGTMFVALTHKDLFLTPFNLNQINPHVVVQQ
ncbi:hypothetical protein MMC22_004720 [Lobaria immixta]|nr:hypothetical protein [Lobaria immixta]